MKHVDEARSPTIRVQSIIYNLAESQIRRSLEYLDNAASQAKKFGVLGAIEVAYGDCSPAPMFDAPRLADLSSRYRNLSEIHYAFFDSNLGSAAGHNRLAQTASTDFIMVLNPDVMVAGNVFYEMLGALELAGVGLVEARQLPIEHHKYYDQETGETSWASTACILCPLKLFKQLHGFDADTFFLYCDDVDFSWRMRLLGYKVVHRSSAVVFHDKRIDTKGRWMASAAEHYFSAEAGLLLPYKYSRPDLTQQIIDHFRRSDDQALLRAAASFELRRKAGKLPSPLDPDHLVAQFIEGEYALSRFSPC